MDLERHGLHRRLFDKFGVTGDAFFLAVAGALAILVSGLAAYWSREPLLFPSLGPTVFLFFEKPLAEGSSPRSALLGYLIALAVGYVSLYVFGLLDAPSVLEVGVTGARVGAATLSVGLTGALLLLARDSHPPAGATTLIVSLGLLTTPRALFVMALGVVLLTAVSWALNRASGVPVSFRNSR